MAEEIISGIGSISKQAEGLTPDGYSYVGIYVKADNGLEALNDENFDKYWVDDLQKLYAMYKSENKIDAANYSFKLKELEFTRKRNMVH